MATDAQANNPSRRAALLGWPIIAVLGGGATLVSLVMLAFLVLVLDVFVLAKGPVTTEYWTIVEARGQFATSLGDSGFRYLVRRDNGSVGEAQLTWRANAGDRVRVRQHQTRILRARIPAEAPVLCNPEAACE